MLALDSEARSWTPKTAGIMSTRESTARDVFCRKLLLRSYRPLRGRHPGEYKPSTERTEPVPTKSAQKQSLTNMVTRRELATSFSRICPYDVCPQPFPFYLLDDSDYTQITQGLTPDWQEVMVVFNVQGEDNYHFARELFLAIVDASGPECETPCYYDRIEKAVDNENGEIYWGDTSEMTQISYDAPDSSDFRSYWTYMPKFRILDQNDFLKTFAVFLMMFLFISIVCILATLIICYTRCQTIALNNRYVFEDLKRLGGSPGFLRGEVRAQCSKVFFLPSLIGMTAMYLLYIGIMYSNDGGHISPTEILGLGLCAVILLIIAGIINLVYRFTLRKICLQLEISNPAK